VFCIINSKCSFLCKQSNNGAEILSIKQSLFRAWRGIERIAEAEEGREKERVEKKEPAMATWRRGEGGSEEQGGKRQECRD
jgi:hypothetical protein